MCDAYLDWARRQRLVDKKGMTMDELFRQLRKYVSGVPANTGYRHAGPAKFPDLATCVAEFKAALTRK